MQAGRDIQVTELVERLPTGLQDRVFENSFGRVVVVHGLPPYVTKHNVMRIFSDFILVPPSEHRCDLPPPAGASSPCWSESSACEPEQLLILSVIMCVQSQRYWMR